MLLVLPGAQLVEARLARNKINKNMIIIFGRFWVVLDWVDGHGIVGVFNKVVGW